MLSIYAKLSSHLHAIWEREKVAVNAQGNVFTLARLKIVPSHHQELASHPMPEHIEALSYLVQKKSSNFPPTAINHVSLMCMHFSFHRTSTLLPFSS